jgi:hypothetical protein
VKGAYEYDPDVCAGLNHLIVIEVCVSPFYLVHEVYEEGDKRNAGYEEESYTPAAESWSLGVVAYEWHLRSST